MQVDVKKAIAKAVKFESAKAHKNYVRAVKRTYTPIVLAPKVR